MDELQNDDSAFVLNDQVAAALEQLAIALAEHRMSAVVTLQQPSQQTFEVTLGMNVGSGLTDHLRAKPASGEASHLGIEEL